ncbi:MAG: methyltransferase FkbM family [Novosphingobium sp.]|nr:methyltransferase FkbM family [Novosphingobium sp.]
MSFESLIGFADKIHVLDIGAAAIAEVPPYKRLLDRGLARLSAIDGDVRQAAGLIAAYGPETQVLTDVIADGARHTLHLAHPESGMSSLLKPSAPHLAFFNGFADFGRIESTQEVDTRRLADIPELQGIDFLKMDIQGAELMVLENAGAALDSCVAIQLEASFIALYEDQPSFGQIDTWMRANGFQPHSFTEVKRWSIAPTIRENNFRMPFNQLLECDIVYVRGLVDLSGLSEAQLKKLLLIAIYCYGSLDLGVHAEQELERRGVLAEGTLAQVFELFAPETLERLMKGEDL